MSVIRLHFLGISASPERGASPAHRTSHRCGAAVPSDPGRTGDQRNRSWHHGLWGRAKNKRQL